MTPLPKTEENIARDSSPEIGVLDLQGGVQEHLDHLQRIGVAGRRVKAARDVAGISGLIIPGGETTCLSRLVRLFGLDEVIVNEYRKGLKIWGTCAGAILLAKEIVGESPHLGLIDIVVQRNAFGSQMDSFTAEERIPRIAPGPLPLTFIRAPKIIRAGSDVDVLLRLDDYIAAAENSGVLVTIFHPELTPSLAFHCYFAKKCGVPFTAALENLSTDASWTDKSWMRFARIPKAMAGTSRAGVYD